MAYNTYVTCAQLVQNMKCTTVALFIIRPYCGVRFKKISVETETFCNTENFWFYRECFSLRTTHGLIEPQYRNGWVVNVSSIVVALPGLWITICGAILVITLVIIHGLGLNLHKITKAKYYTTKVPSQYGVLGLEKCSHLWHHMVWSRPCLSRGYTCVAIWNLY